MITKTPAKKRRIVKTVAKKRRTSGTHRAMRGTAVRRERRRTRATSPNENQDGEPATATFGADLIEGLEQVLEHQRGKVDLEQVWPKPVDVKAIRQRVKMSQAEFSRAYGISKRALQEWEQGGRRPDSTARAYLTVIAQASEVVRRVLKAAHKG